MVMLQSAYNEALKKDLRKYMLNKYVYFIFLLLVYIVHSPHVFIARLKSFNEDLISPSLHHPADKNCSHPEEFI